MSNIEMDWEVYEAWLKDKRQTIENMTTKEELDARIEELAKIQFFARREWAMLHERFDAITGKKRIPTHMLRERDKLITEPNIKVNWDGDPRKIAKEKKPKEKEDLVQKFFGIDMKQAIREMRAKPKQEVIKEKKASDEEILNTIAPPPKPKLTPEEIREKIRLAKEKMNAGKQV